MLSCKTNSPLAAPRPSAAMRWCVVGLTVLPLCGGWAAEPAGTGTRGRTPQVSAEEDGSANSLRETVMRLVRELDADRFSTRRAAEQRLLELGPPVLKWLPDEDTLPTASQRLAVRRIRTALQSRLARDALRPGRIRLKGAYRLGEILRHLQQASGNPVDYAGNTRLLNVTIPVAFGDAAFLECLDRLCERLPLNWQTDVTLGRVVIGDRVAGLSRRPCLAVAYPGLFRVCCAQVSTRSLPADDTRRLLQTTLVVASEPRIRPLFMMVRQKDFTARAIAADGTLRELPPFDPEAAREITFGGSTGTATFALDWLADATLLRAVELSGTLRPLVAATQQRFAFDLSKADALPRQQQFGPVRIELRSVRFVAAAERPQATNAGEKPDDAARTGRAASTRQPRSPSANRTTPEPVAAGSPGPAGTLHVRLLVNYGASGPAFESHRTWLYHNRVYIERRGAANEPIRPAPNFRTGLTADGLLEIEYTFALPTPPVAGDTLVYYAPTLLTELTVPIRLTIPLRDGRPDPDAGAH